MGLSNEDPLVIAGKSFRSRLILGTGKYRNHDDMNAAFAAAGTEIITVALRRLDLDDPTNNTLLDYRMPIAMDLPMIDTVIVEVANPGHPFGVRGVGEVSIVPPPAAIANALHGALGIRMDRLPMNPGAVLKALWKQSK